MLELAKVGLLKGYGKQKGQSICYCPLSCPSCVCFSVCFSVFLLSFISTPYDGHSKID